MPEHWWQRLPQRVIDEDARLQELIAEGTIAAYSWKKQPSGDLWLTADLHLGTRTQSVELRFPSRYPGECPSLRPIPYGTRLSSHQFGGEGVLCLELGPDNWHARFMAADLLISAWKLLVLEVISQGEPLSIPSRHVETIGMIARSSSFRLMVTPELLQAIEANTARLVPIEYGTFFEDAIVFWVTHIPPGTVLDRLPPRVAACQSRAGIAVRVNDGVPPPPSEVGAFRTYLRDAGVGDDQVERTSGLVLLTVSANLLARWVPESADSPVLSVVTIPSVGQSADRLGIIATTTSKARIAIVGLGSLGSKVATSLARSGVRTMATVDGDVLLPENVVRHDADFSHVGLMKVEAAAVRVCDVAPHPVAVTKFEHDVADATNPAIHASTTEALRQADLIVDATASMEAFNFLADLASEERRPLVWGEIFAGGLGGYVAYAVPGVTPCPSCVRSAFLAHLEQWPPAPRGAAQRYGAVAADEPFIASDADVTAIGGILTAIALRVLARDLDGCSPIAVVGLRRGWIFERAFEVRLLPVRMDDFSCARCWTRPGTPNTELLAQVEKLLN